MKFFKAFLIACMLFAGSTVFAADNVKIEIQPGSESDIAGYRLLYGSESGQYTENIDLGSPPLIDGLIKADLPTIPDTLQYYVVVAYDTGNPDLTSKPSIEYPFDPVPGAPNILRMFTITVNVTVTE